MGSGQWFQLRRTVRRAAARAGGDARLTHGHLRISFGPDLEVPTADDFLDDLATVVADLRDPVRQETS